ncbi:hypothetical protein FQA39_LY10817 [Lamprigera yunnana]|nr:hypothetical protein FQA39_LY10817 [Lamprigera yunnana]
MKANIFIFIAILLQCIVALPIDNFKKLPENDRNYVQKRYGGMSKVLPALVENLKSEGFFEDNKKLKESFICHNSMNGVNDEKSNIDKDAWIDRLSNFNNNNNRNNLHISSNKLKNQKDRVTESELIDMLAGLDLVWPNDDKVSLKNSGLPENDKHYLQKRCVRKSTVLPELVENLKSEGYFDHNKKLEKFVICDDLRKGVIDEKGNNDNDAGINRLINNNNNVYSPNRSKSQKGTLTESNFLTIYRPLLQ